MEITKSFISRAEMNRSRVRGCLLGGAIGDALGAPVEFMSEAKILDQFGKEGISDFIPVYGGVKGAITDDTQMTLFTAEGLILAQLYNTSSIQEIADAYQRWYCMQTVGNPTQNGILWQEKRLYQRRSPGMTCLSACQKMKSLATRATNNDSKGCGGVMRVAPIGLFFLSSPTEKVFSLAEHAAALTHAHPTGSLSAGVFAVLIQQLSQGKSLPEALLCGKEILRHYPDHEETLKALEHAEVLAKKKGNRITELGQGWVAEEALAISVYCALVAKNFAEGVILAVNHGGDSDSTGSITGNLLGCQFGLEVIPKKWLVNLELKMLIQQIADDLLLMTMATSENIDTCKIRYRKNRCCS